MMSYPFWSFLGPFRSMRSNTTFTNQTARLSDQFQAIQNDVQQSLEKIPSFGHTF